MSKSYNFCNNCGENGHVFHNCRHPITSIGLIAFRRDKDAIRYLLICRKDTLGYVDFIRGKYNIHSKTYIQNIFNEMTIEEKERIKSASIGDTINFNDLWNSLWGDKVGIQYRGEEKISREKFKSLTEGIGIDKNRYDLLSIIESSNTKWEYPEWGFPKGRRNYQEKDLTCALREFEEETGISTKGLKIIQNLYPFEETFTGSNYKSYKHCYYVAEAIECIPTNSGHQETEVSNVAWMTYEEAINIIRPYNIEKKELLLQVNKMLTEYRICS